jgi:phosphoribosylformylglycinamidine cyclo-ligase
MNVNDLICVGAEPVGIVDYLAVERVNERVVKSIMRGLVSGAKEAGVAILGGETAVLPDIIRGAVEGRGFDLAATSIGVVDEDRVILGNRVAGGDAVVGLASSGIHSNGLTLARRVLIGEKLKMVREKLPGFDRSVGEELLVPTRIYVRAVRELLRSLDVHGLAHITGGSFGKLRRLSEYSRTGFQLDSMPDPQPLFNEIQRIGRVSDKEMYGTFNMGVGLCVVVDRESGEDAVDVCEKAGFGASVVGKVVQESGVKVRPPKGRWFSLP